MRSNHPGKDTEELKKALRYKIQDKRDYLPLKARQEKTARITGNLFLTGEYCNARNMLVYYPFRSEIDTRPIIEDALKLGKNIALPRVNGKKLDLYYIRDISKDLEPGSFDIMEPVPSRSKPAKYDMIDFVLVPGVAFDHEMNRLGYGGGFYDRILKKIPENTPRIAIAFDMQVVEHIPVSSHDLKIDLLITESGIFGKNKEK